MPNYQDARLGQLKLKLRSLEGQRRTATGELMKSRIKSEIQSIINQREEPRVTRTYTTTGQTVPWTASTVYEINRLDGTNEVSSESSFFSEYYKKVMQKIYEEHQRTREYLDGIYPPFCPTMIRVPNSSPITKVFSYHLELFTYAN